MNRTHSPSIVFAFVVATALAACGGSPKAADAPAPAPAGHGAHHAATEPADGHAGHGAHHAAAEPAPADGVVPPGEAQVGDATTCPVSGRAFTVAADSPSVEHDGKTYYFCCPGCDKRFANEPEKYLTN